MNLSTISSSFIRKYRPNKKWRAQVSDKQQRDQTCANNRGDNLRRFAIHGRSNGLTNKKSHDTLTLVRLIRWHCVKGHIFFFGWRFGSQEVFMRVGFDSNLIFNWFVFVFQFFSQCQLAVTSQSSKQKHRISRPIHTHLSSTLNPGEVEQQLDNSTHYGAI